MELIIFIFIIVGLILWAREFDSSKKNEQKKAQMGKNQRTHERLLNDARKGIFKRTESPIEEELFKILIKKEGIVTQCPVYDYLSDKTYRLDFGFPEHKIGFEADGHDFHSSRSDKISDAKRDGALANPPCEWVIYRFQGTLISRHPDYVEDEINKILSHYGIRDKD